MVKKNCEYRADVNFGLKDKHAIISNWPGNGQHMV